MARFNNDVTGADRQHSTVVSHDTAARAAGSDIISAVTSATPSSYPYVSARPALNSRHIGRTGTLSLSVHLSLYLSVCLSTGTALPAKRSASFFGH